MRGQVYRRKLSEARGESSASAFRALLVVYHSARKGEPKALVPLRSPGRSQDLPTPFRACPHGLKAGMRSRAFRRSSLSRPCRPGRGRGAGERSVSASALPAFRALPVQAGLRGGGEGEAREGLGGVGGLSCGLTQKAHPNERPFFKGDLHPAVSLHHRGPEGEGPQGGGWIARSRLPGSRVRAFLPRRGGPSSGGSARGGPRGGAPRPPDPRSPLPPASPLPSPAVRASSLPRFHSPSPCPKNGPRPRSASSRSVFGRLPRTDMREARSAVEERIYAHKAGYRFLIQQTQLTIKYLSIRDIPHPRIIKIPVPTTYSPSSSLG